MRKLLISLVFLPLLSFAQNQWSWAKNSIGGNNQEGYSIVADGTGNLYATGYYEIAPITFGPYTFSNSGWDDIFLVKLDSSGNILWAKTVGGTQSEEGNGVAVDAMGGVFLTGHFQSPNLVFGTYTLAPVANSFDIYTAKYDSSGNPIWVKKAGGMGTDESNSVATDKKGNVVITGYFNSSSIAIGNSVVNATPGNNTADIFLAKYSSSGTPVWCKRAGGTTDDVSYEIATDKSDNVYITGRFTSSAISFGTYTLTNSGDSDFFIAKYDSSGNVLWAKSAGGSLYESGYGITTDNFGNVYVTGVFYSNAISFGSYTLNNSGGTDLFIVKYDSYGNVKWIRNALGSWNDAGYNITADIYGNVYVTGLLNSPSLTFGNISLSGSGIDPMFFVKYDSLGNVLCATSLENGGGGPDNNENGITTDLFGNVYIIADYGGAPSFTIGTNTLTSTGDENVFIAKSNLNFQFTASANNPLCVGQNINLGSTIVNGAIYSWSGPNSYTSAIQNPIITNASVSNSGEYILHVSGNGCFLSDSVNVIVNPLPVVRSSDDTICMGKSVQLNVNGANAYTWSPPTGLSNNTISSPVASPGITTQYSITGTDINGCKDTTTILVTVLTVTSVVTADPISGNSPLTVNFTMTSSGSNYSWNYGNGYTQSTTSYSANSIYSNPGTYTATVITTNSFGCADTESVVIIVDMSIVVPNVFTPNGDGINDLFSIKNNGYISLEAGIYDRWGLLLWETTSLDGTWDGKRNGKDVPDGTYYYIIKATNYYQKEKDFRGYILLTR